MYCYVLCATLCALVDRSYMRDRAYMISFHAAKLQLFFEIYKKNQRFLSEYDSDAIDKVQ